MLGILVVSDSEIITRINVLTGDEKRPTVDALAQTLGLEPDDISDQQEFVDALTGRRSNPECPPCGTIDVIQSIEVNLWGRVVGRMLPPRFGTSSGNRAAHKM